MVKYFFLVTSFFYCASSKARHWTASSNYSSTFTNIIQQAKRYDTIYLQAGNYISHNTIIQIPLTIIGLNYPNIDGQQKDEVITILSDSVTIQGCVVKNSFVGSMKDYAGIRVFQHKHIKLLNNKLVNTFFGIYLSDTEDVEVNGNDLKGALYGSSDAGNGIHLWKCKNIYIANNHIEGHRDGIYFEFVKHSNIVKNYSEKNFRYGLHFMFSDDDVYVDNIFTNNGTGVAVMYSKKVEMRNNRFEHSWGGASYGLLLKEISNSRIIGNTFNYNTIGIFMEGCNYINLQYNNLTDNGYAIKMMANCTYDTIRLCNFLGNSFDFSTNGESYIDNLVENNYWSKYEGYDLNKDKIGDLPFYPCSLYAQIVEKIPYAIMLHRSLIALLMDKAEKAIPSIISDHIVDKKPYMQIVQK